MTETASAPFPSRVALPQLLLSLSWVALVIAAFREISDNSFLWHITAGHLQSDEGVVLTADPFSFTVGGERWLSQSWLAELGYSAAERTFGIGFVGVMVLVVSILTALAVGLIAYRRSSSVPTTAVVLLLSLVLLLPTVVPRPVLFSYMLFVLLILAWDRPESRWATPFVMWVWAAVHGSFVIGLVFLALTTISKRDWKALPHLFVAGAATLFTAHGLHIVEVLLDFARAGPYLDLIEEWRTPDFVSPGLFPFAIGILLIIYGSMKGRLRTESLFVIAPFMILAMMATRSVAVAWLALVPEVASALGGLRWSVGRGFSRAAALMVVGVIGVLPFALVSPTTLDEETFPRAAGESLHDVRTFHDDLVGGYLIYAQLLSEGVFIDDRAELYRERLRELVEVRVGSQPWQEVFERDGIEQALLRVGEPLIGDLTTAGWTTSFRDSNFVVLASPSDNG